MNPLSFCLLNRAIFFSTNNMDRIIKTNGHVLFPLVIPYLNDGDRVALHIAFPSSLKTLTSYDKLRLERSLFDRFPSVSPREQGLSDDKLLQLCIRCFSYNESLVLGRIRGLRIHPSTNIRSSIRDVLSVTVAYGSDEALILTSDSRLFFLRLRTPFNLPEIDSLKLPEDAYTSRRFPPCCYRVQGFIALCGNAHQKTKFASCFRFSPRLSTSFEASPALDHARCERTYSCNGTHLAIGQLFPSTQRDYNSLYYSVYLFGINNNKGQLILRAGGGLPEVGVHLHNFYVTPTRFTILRTWKEGDGTIVAGTTSYSLSGTPLDGVDTSLALPSRAVNTFGVAEVIVSPAPFFSQFSTVDVVHLTNHHIISLGVRMPGTDRLCFYAGRAFIFPGGMPLCTELQPGPSALPHFQSFAALHFSMIYCKARRYDVDLGTTLMRLTSRTLPPIIRFPSRLSAGNHRHRPPSFLHVLPGGDSDDDAPVAPLLSTLSSDDIRDAHFDEYEDFDSSQYEPFVAPEWIYSSIDII